MTDLFDEVVDLKKWRAAKAAEKVKPKLHCWEDAPGGGATCMLPRGHDGEHEFTPDSEISVRFGPEKVEPKHLGCDKCIHREVAERCRACGILTGAACYTNGEMYPDYEEADE